MSMSPRYFAKAYKNRRYNNPYYQETTEANLEYKIESLLSYLWKKLWKKK